MAEEQSKQNEEKKPAPIKSVLSQYGYAVPYYGGIAKILGQTEALVLAQIDYWLNYYKARGDRKHYKDGTWKIYITIAQLQAQIIDRNEKTIREAVTNLAELGILNVSHHSGGSYGRTNWYSINYDILDNIMQNNDKRVYSKWLAENREKKVKAEKTSTLKQRIKRPIEVEKTSGSKAEKFSGSEVEKTSETITELTTIINKHKNINSCPFKNQEHGNSREKLFDYITVELNAADIVANTIISFLDNYTLNGYGSHPSLSKDMILKMSDEFYDAVDRNRIVDEDWKYMIKEYFSQNFKEKCDHKIYHFFTSGVLDNLYHHVTDRAG